jgi:hypothetical protein
MMMRWTWLSIDDQRREGQGGIHVHLMVHAGAAVLLLGALISSARYM